jgi:hypothetical protein
MPVIGPPGDAPTMPVLQNLAVEILHDQIVDAVLRPHVVRRSALVLFGLLGTRTAREAPLSLGVHGAVPSACWRTRLNTGGSAMKRSQVRAIGGVVLCWFALAAAVAGDEKADKKKTKIDHLAQATLKRLFAENPKTKPLYERSYGYAVFDARQTKIMVAGDEGKNAGA